MNASHYSKMETFDYEQITIYFSNELAQGTHPQSYIKLTIHNTQQSEISIDLHLSQLEPNYKVKQFRSREITANFKFLGITYPTGVFYTDSNSYKVVKRNISLNNDSTNRAAYFYPV